MDLVTLAVVMAASSLVLGLVLARRDRVVAVHPTPSLETERVVLRLVDHIFALHYLIRKRYPDADLPPPPLTGAASAINGSAQPLDVAKARPIMAELMSFEELCNAAFDLDFDHSYTNSGPLLRNLLGHLHDRKKTGLLRQWLQRNRPDIAKELEK